MPWVWMGISQWLLYAGVALAAVVCIGVVARAVWIPADIRRRCCCGGCGYAMSDVAAGRCPECGAALNRVGVTTPAMAVRLRGSLGWALLAWTTLFVLAAGPAWMFIEQAAMLSASMAAPGVSTTSVGGPQQVTHQFSLVPHTSWSGGEAPAPPRQDFRIDCNVIATTDSASTVSSTAAMALRINGDSRIVTLDLDKERGTYELVGVGGKELATGAIERLDEALVRKWFEAAGVETTSAESGRSISDALRFARMSVNDAGGLDSSLGGTAALEAGNLRTSGHSSSSGPAGVIFTAGGMPVMPSPWSAGVLVGAGIGAITYLAGVVLIIWRNRRLLA